ncbi:hypothetical protein ALT1644_460013 [Alteromonas macleodii]|nr:MULTISPECIES: hypothetical protein [Gammaproteobacteria]
MRERQELWGRTLSIGGAILSIVAIGVFSRSHGFLVPELPALRWLQHQC